MDSFDKKIKNIFEYIDDVPDSLDWENMEDGIYDKMNKLQTSTAKPSGNTWKIVLWGSISIAALFIIYFSWTNYVKKQNQAEIVTEQLKQKNELKPAYDKKSTPSDINDSGIVNDDKNVPEQVVEPTPVDSREQNVKNENSSQSMEADDDIVDSDVENNIENNDLKKSKVDVSVDNRSTGENIAGPTGNKEKKVVKQPDVPQSSSQSVSHGFRELPVEQNRDVVANPSSNVLNNVIEKLPFLPAKTLDLSSDAGDIMDFVVKADIPVMEAVGSTSKLDLDFAVEINSGINYWTGVFKDAPAMSRYTKNKIGFYNSLDAVLSTPKWDFALGYKYRYINQLLDYEKVTMVPVSFDSVLLHTFTESYTHVVENIYGDTTVMRQRTIRIVNYNSMVSHIGVVGVARKFQINRQLTCGIRFGAQYTFNTTAKGVRLDDQAQYSIYKNDAGKQLELNTGVFLAYSIKPKWMLISNLSYNKVIGDWKVADMEITGQNIVNFGVGLRYLL